MKASFSWMICGILFIRLASSAHATNSIQLVGMEGRSSPAAVNLPAVFGNKEKEVDLEINGVTVSSVSLHADLFQISGTLAMPLAKDIHLQEGLTLSTPPPQRLRVSIKFPNVKQQAEILVRLSLAKNAPDKTAALGDLRFEVFPTSVTKELTDLLQPKSNAKAMVFGPGQKLRHFLTSAHVSFEDGGSDTPDRFDPNRLYFGELSTKEQFQQVQDRSNGAHVVLFSPDESLPAGVYSDRSNPGIFIQVTSPLLDNLDDDPRAQLGFIKIIHLLSASPSSAI